MKKISIILIILTMLTACNNNSENNLEETIDIVANQSTTTITELLPLITTTTEPLTIETTVTTTPTTTVKTTSDRLESARYGDFIVPYGSHENFAIMRKTKGVYYDSRRDSAFFDNELIEDDISNHEIEYVRLEKGDKIGDLTVESASAHFDGNSSEEIQSFVYFTGETILNGILSYDIIEAGTFSYVDEDQYFLFFTPTINHPGIAVPVKENLIKITEIGSDFKILTDSQSINLFPSSNKGCFEKDEIDEVFKGSKYVELEVKINNLVLQHNMDTIMGNHADLVEIVEIHNYFD